MLNRPKVSVLMPVYNGAKYLPQAVESILRQTFRDFEFLITDDGSSDGSQDIIGRYQRLDSRIRFVSHKVNLGLPGTLNECFQTALGELWLRMDQDDISSPERVGKQVDFMDKHPQVGICGSWVRTIGGRFNRIVKFAPADEVIRAQMLFFDPIAHPTVIMRRSVMQGNQLFFDPAFDHADDYELWTRAAAFCRFANIPEVLLHYRISAGQMGSKHKHSQDRTTCEIRKIQLQKLNYPFSREEIELHSLLDSCQAPVGTDFVLRAKAWLLTLQQLNKEKSWFNGLAFNKALGQAYYSVLQKNISYDWTTLRELFISPFPIVWSLRLRALFKFLAIKLGLLKGLK